MMVLVQFNKQKMVAGHSNSNDGDVSGHHGATITSSDMWVVKIDSLGILQWQKSLGGSNNDYGSSIQQAIDGGYIVAGHSISNDGDVTGHHGVFLNNDKYDYWIVKLFPDGVLPVSLLNFTAKKKEQSVLLMWQTATEINTNFFNIERSFDGIHFNNIGKVNAVGNSNIIQNYKYNDNSLSRNSEVYYRLQTIDVDGAGSYSKIEKVNFTTPEMTFIVYPNPAKSVIYVNTKGIIAVTIADNSGRVMINKNIITDDKTAINITGLSKGEYLVSAKNNNGIIQKTIKLVVE